MSRTKICDNCGLHMPEAYGAAQVQEKWWSLERPATATLDGGSRFDLCPVCVERLLQGTPDLYAKVYPST